MKTKQKRLVWSPEETPRVYICRQIEGACAENQPVLRAFADWLAEVRGLAPESVTLRLASIRCFINAVTVDAKAPGIPSLESLTPRDIEDFFVGYGKDHKLPSRRSMRSALRLFLAFAASKGWVDRELVDTVPSLASYRLSSLPRGLNDEELRVLLGSPWNHGQCPLRNRAIVYLLATYGVRRRQVSALQLVDISWSAQTIVFAAHKGGKSVHHVLTEAVAEALSDYLRHERPASDSADVFLRPKRPYVRLSPNAITDVVKKRMVLCGLPPRSPHALRHTFATRLLRAGESIKAIADLLGHRSLSTLAIYAKVDYARLLEVAVEWPEEVEP